MKSFEEAKMGDDDAFKTEGVVIPTTIKLEVFEIKYLRINELKT